MRVQDRSGGVSVVRHRGATIGVAAAARKRTLDGERSVYVLFC